MFLRQLYIWLNRIFLEYSIYIYIYGSTLALCCRLPHYYHDNNIDRASRVLAQGVPPSVPTLYRALIDYHGNVSHSTLYYYARGRPSREEKA
jgi:hypothetical protein